MQKKLIILIGTMSGTAEMVADELSESEALGSGEIEVQLLRMDKVNANIFQGSAVFLYCTSTYGTGEPPDNAKALYEELTEKRPDLNGVQYGVVGLGDSKYAESFCGGPKGFDQIMSELGATRIGELCELDASSGDYPEEVAQEWFDEWINEV